jgi:uncharacterized protein YjbI with pentapeptide repeats
MNEERMQILKMLQEGKITVDEAAKLIEAIDHKLSEDVNATIAEDVKRVEPVITVTNQTPVASPVEARGPSPLALRWSLLTFLFSNLEGAQIDGGLYQDAKILCSNLHDAHLRGGNFEDAWLLCTNLESANFEGANLRGARIFASNLNHADFRGADLQDAIILCANLDHADFRNADLRGKSFVGVNLAGFKSKEPVSIVTLES